MQTTIEPDKAWEYIDVLNECLRLILTVLLGMGFGYFGILDHKAVVPIATQLVFYVCLPMLVIRGLGIGIDFYDESFSWIFISLFLVLRAIALIINMAWVYFFNRDKGFGQVAVYWLASTWISTIILGVPISTAVFGSPAVGLKYGVLAGISSFIFQLPLQLFFLEYHAETWIKDTTTDMDEKESIHKDIEHEVEEQVIVDEYDDVERDVEEETSESAAARNTLAQTSSSVNLQVAKKVSRRIVRNPVLWGIVLGFTLSLSTLGPTFLHPKKPDYVPGLGWVWTTAEWFGDCVSPVSLFAMGLWMQSQGLNLFRLGWRDSCLFMLMKLVLVPLIMLGLACAVSLDDEAGRAAVLIATLPISMASFTLADVFDIGQAILAQNVAMGTILLLPTVLIWNLVLDHAGVFPIS